MTIPASARTVLVLGANGRFGRCAVQAFSQGGWQVIAHSRSALVQPLPPNSSHLQCDALDTEALIAAAKGRVEVIVHALNPAYDDWERQVPALTDSVLRLAQATGALLMLPGNVYNFGRELPPALTEDTPQLANTSKAVQRIALEQRMQGTSGVQSVVIRAGDFIGGDGPGTWLDMVIAKKLDKGEATYLGPLDVEHAWAYLPDLAQVFVKVAERRAMLPAFSIFHYAGLALNGYEFCTALERVTGRTLKIKPMPWWLLRLASPFSGMMRALLEMRYLWDRPHRLEESRLRALIGEVPRTGIDAVLRKSCA